jgi:chitinase
MKGLCLIAFSLLTFFALMSSNPVLGATVELTWDLNTEPDVVGYRVYWSNYSGNTKAMRNVIGTKTATGPPVTVSMSETDKFYFRLTAYNASQESLFSNVVFMNFIGTPKALKFQKIEIR